MAAQLVDVRTPRPRTARLVATQVVLALLVAAAGAGTRALLLAALPAAMVLGASWLRIRGRWLADWLAVAARFLLRRRVLGPDTGVVGLLGMVAPGTGLDPAVLDPAVLDAGGPPREPATVLTDPAGLVMVLEVGDPDRVLGHPPRPAPRPGDLLPALAAGTPRVGVRLLLATVPAPAPGETGAHAAGYRELTGGRPPGGERVLLTVEVRRGGGWAERELRHALAGAARRIRRRLAPVVVTPLDGPAILDAVADLARYEPGQPVREDWSTLRVGGQHQVTYRVGGWSDPAGGDRLLSGLLALPTAAVTVASAPGRGGGFVVRLTAPSTSALAAAVAATRRLVADEGGIARRLDGEHLAGLAATLPLGLGSAVPAPTPPGPDGDAGPVVGRAGPVFGDAGPVFGDAGLGLAVDRHGGPVTARLFRPRSTDVLLIGGLRPARLVTVRARAVGARVVVRTDRPAAWRDLATAVDPGGDTMAVLPPDQPVEATGTPVHPLLVVLDRGSTAAPAGGRPAPSPRPTPGPRPGRLDDVPRMAWMTTLVIRGGLGPADRAALARADLVLVGRLRPEEAALVGGALGLDPTADWLSRIGDDMVGIASHGELRWAVLAATPTESRLIGPATEGGRGGQTAARHGTMPGWVF